MVVNPLLLPIGGVLVRLFAEPAALRLGLPAGEGEWQRLAHALKELR